MGAQESGNDSRSLTAMFTMLEIFEKLPQVDFVLLSAMVKNSHDIADWLKSVTHRECLVFDDKWKPTRQLQGCLVYEQTEIKQLQNKARTYPQHKSKKKIGGFYACNTLVLVLFKNGLEFTKSKGL